MIIKAANAFDDMVGPSTDRHRSAAALERMRLDPVAFDTGVVAVLAEVAGRRVPSWLAAKEARAPGGPLSYRRDLDDVL